MPIDYKHEIIKARDYYFSLPKEVFCRCVGEDILLTRIGWDHLVNNKKRNLKQTYRRVKHIYLVKSILEEMPYFQVHSVRYKDIHEHKYWSIQAVLSKACIEIVIRQTGNQQKHFYSLVYKGGSPRVID